MMIILLTSIKAFYFMRNFKLGRSMSCKPL